jgi:hypothetical protein
MYFIHLLCACYSLQNMLFAVYFITMAQAFDTSVRYAFSTSFGLAEVILGVICMVQGCETGDWDAVEGGLKAIGGGLQSIEEGIEARISWGGIAAQFCRLIYLAIRIRVAQFNAPKN